MGNFDRIASAVGRRVKGSPVVVWIEALVGILVIICGVLMWEDVSTTHNSYLMIPTAKVNMEIVAWAIGFLPTFGQIVLYYAFMDDPRKRIVGLMGLFLTAADITCDVYYKSSGFTRNMGWSIFESVVFFSVGSELLGTLSIGLFIKTLPYAARQLQGAQIGGNLFSGLIYADNGEDDDEEEYLPPRRPQPPAHRPSPPPPSRPAGGSSLPIRAVPPDLFGGMTDDELEQLTREMEKNGGGKKPAAGGRPVTGPPSPPASSQKGNGAGVRTQGGIP